MKTFDRVIIIISSVLILLFVGLFLLGISWFMSSSIEGARERHEVKESERQELMAQVYGTNEEEDSFTIIRSYEMTQHGGFQTINWKDFEGDTGSLSYHLEAYDEVTFYRELSELPYNTEQFEKELLKIIIGQ